MNKYLVIMLTLLFVGCGQPKQQLNVLIWANDIAPGVISEFEREHDCKVVLDFFDDAGAVIPKLAAGGVARYDVACIGDVDVPAVSNLGLVAPLRRENLPNFKNLDPVFTNMEFDPGNQFSIPYDWVTLGLFMRRPTNAVVEESWALIFDPAKQPGPFVLVDDMRNCLGAALRYKGYSINTTNRQELTEARDLLIEAKKRSLGFQVGTGNRNRVLSRNAALAVTWNGGVAKDMKENPDIVFFLPREGTQVGLDNLCIMAKAPHRDLAEKFLNYLMEPRIAVQHARFFGVPTPNKAARELLPPEERNNPAIYPPPEMMRRLEYPKNLGDQQRLYDELWTQIKAK